jgi:hypothetical protein
MLCDYAGTSQVRRKRYLVDSADVADIAAACRPIQKTHAANAEYC